MATSCLGAPAPRWVTWTVLESTAPKGLCPWTPSGAAWWTSGHSSPGTPQAPVDEGRWWSVLAGWHDLHHAQASPPSAAGVTSWHVLLQPMSVHGDVRLGGRGRLLVGPDPDVAPPGAVAAITVAGASRDESRQREFVRRFMHASRDVREATGHVMSMVQAPAVDPDAGPVLTFSVWQDLNALRDWAYVRSRPHSSAVTRQREHQLVEYSRSLRCVVLASNGTLAGRANPLAALTLAGQLPG